MPRAEKKRLPSIASALPAPALSQSEIDEFAEVFQLVDKDANGVISKDELDSIFTALGLRISQEQVDEIVKEIDPDGRDDIDLEAFLKAAQYKINIPYSPDQVKAAFRVFELPGKPGFIRTEGLEQALARYATIPARPEDIKKLVGQLQPDTSGLVSIDAYVDLLMR